MIILPPGFDYSLLLSDFFAFFLPFAGVLALFAGYRILMKALGHV